MKNIPSIRSSFHSAFLNEGLWVDQLPVRIFDHFTLFHHLSLTVDFVAPELPIVNVPVLKLHLAPTLLYPVLELTLV